MESLPSVRMTANLNSMIRGQQSIEQAERAILGGDVAHHVIDPAGALGLDPLQASTLDEALEALLNAEHEGWFLALPIPGSLAPLRGPADFNLAALRTRRGRGGQQPPVSASCRSRSVRPFSGGSIQPSDHWRLAAPTTRSER